MLIASLTWGGAERLLAEFAAGAPSAGIELSVGLLEERDGSPVAPVCERAGWEPCWRRARGGAASIAATPDVRRQLAEVRPDVVHTHLGSADLLGARGALAGDPGRLDHPRGAAARPGTAQQVKERLMSLARRRGQQPAWRCRRRRAPPTWKPAGTPAPAVVTVHNGIAVDPGRGAVERCARSSGSAPRRASRRWSRCCGPARATRSPSRPSPGCCALPAAAAAGRRRRARRAEIERLVAPLGDAALLLGHRTDVLELLGASDVLLHPTNMDAFPTVLLEAGAGGVPVLARAVGGIPEIVEDGRPACWWGAPPSADERGGELARLLADGDLRARLGAAAATRFERLLHRRALGRAAARRLRDGMPNGGPNRRTRS